MLITECLAYIMFSINNFSRKWVRNIFQNCFLFLCKKIRSKVCQLEFFSKKKNYLYRSYFLISGTLNTASAVETDTLNTSTSSQNTTECIVCYEKVVDCVIYTCGHMCLCYECGLQQWRGRGAGICPMCRMPIRDIIRTFRN